MKINQGTSVVTRFVAVVGVLSLAFATGFTCSKSENKPAAESTPAPAQEQMAAPAAPAEGTAPAPTEAAPAPAPTEAAPNK